MPLLDHFRPPLSVRHPWQSIHSAWANAIVRQLNEDVLPERYYALPNVQPEGRLEVDVAAFEQGGNEDKSTGLATAVWAPAQPTLRIPVVELTLDAYEVQVLNDEEGRIVAAVELVSPRNKDRPASRQAFLWKCAALLQQGVSVTVVDAVTRRTGDLHEQLLAMFAGKLTVDADENSLRASTYRLLRDEGASHLLESWVEPLGIGVELATLPLWLAADLAVPLDLEQSYNATCHALRLPV